MKIKHFCSQNQITLHKATAPPEAKLLFVALTLRQAQPHAEAASVHRKLRMERWPYERCWHDNKTILPTETFLKNSCALKNSLGKWSTTLTCLHATVAFGLFKLLSSTCEGG
jgi:hypothetical protein